MSKRILCLFIQSESVNDLFSVILVILLIILMILISQNRAIVSEAYETFWQIKKGSRLFIQIKSQLCSYTYHKHPLDFPKPWNK